MSGNLHPITRSANAAERPQGVGRPAGGPQTAPARWFSAQSPAMPVCPNRAVARPPVSPSRPDDTGVRRSQTTPRARAACVRDHAGVSAIGRGVQLLRATAWPQLRCPVPEEPYGRRRMANERGGNAQHAETRSRPCSAHACAGGRSAVAAAADRRPRAAAAAADDGGDGGDGVDGGPRPK